MQEELEDLPDDLDDGLPPVTILRPEEPEVTLPPPSPIPTEGRDTFTVGRIAQSVDHAGYFQRQLAKVYLDRQTVLPTRTGRELLQADWSYLMPDERIVLREMVRLMRNYHRADVRQMAGLLNLPQHRIKALYVIADEDAASVDLDEAVAVMDKTSVEAARQAGITNIVNSLYRMGMKAHDSLINEIDNLDPAERIKLMSVSLKAATDMSKSITGGGRMKVGEMNEEQLKEKLKEAVKLLGAMGMKNVEVIQ